MNLTTPRAWRIHAVIGLLSLVWGSTYFVIREGLEDLTPFTAAAVRFSLAAAVVTLLARLLRSRLQGGAPGVRLSLTMGTLNFAVPYGLVYWSETILPSGLVSVLWAVFPMLMAIVGHFFLQGERLRGRQWSGFVVGFLGVALLFRTDLQHVGPAAIPAALLLLLSPAAAAAGQGLVKRQGREVSSLLLNRNGMLIGAALLWGAAWFERDLPRHWTPRAWLSIGYLALVGTVLTFGLYFWALRHAASYKMSVIAYLTPALALTVGAVFGDERVGLSTVTGTAMILAGVALVMLGNRVPRPWRRDRSTPPSPVSVARR